MYCLQVRRCIFQPGNCTGWGSEGVKHSTPADFVNTLSAFLHCTSHSKKADTVTVIFTVLKLVSSMEDREEEEEEEAAD